MISNKICYFNNEKDRIDVIDNKVYINNVLTEKIGQGVDGVVHRHQDLAIKLYHDNSKIKSHLTDYQIDILTSIKTKHIILPKQSLVSDKQNPGFVMEYINLKTENDIYKTNFDDLITQISELEEELSIIGKNNFLLDDLQSRNLFYNGNLYLFDPDNFIYDKKTNFSRRNLEIFSWYFMRDIIFSLNNEFTEKEQNGLVRKFHYLYKKGKYTSLAEFLIDYIYESNLGEFRENFKKEKVR